MATSQSDISVVSAPPRPSSDGAMVVSSDGASFNIGVLLTKSNYDLWAPLFEMHMAGRRKMGFLRGSIPMPTDMDPKFDDWFAEDQKVKSWLLLSMIPDLMRRFIRLPTMASIWSALKSSFVDDKDEVQVYTLNQRAARKKQNRRPVSIYFGELMEVFQELDHLTTLAMKFDPDLQLYKAS